VLYPYITSSCGRHSPGPTQDPPGHRPPPPFDRSGADEGENGFSELSDDRVSPLCNCVGGDLLLLS
jgi:hypothetical protein